MTRTIITLCLISLACFAFTGSGIRNYQCRKCGILVWQDRTPSYSGCPAGGSHSWVNLGEVGDKNYQCRKCATLVRSKQTPSYTGCPAGSSHSWRKL